MEIYHFGRTECDIPKSNFVVFICESISITDLNERERERERETVDHKLSTVYLT